MSDQTLDQLPVATSTMGLALYGVQDGQDRQAPASLLVGQTGPQGPQGPQGNPGATTWDGITNKPMTFPAAAHQHTAAAISDLAAWLARTLTAGANISLTPNQDGSITIAATSGGVADAGQITTGTLAPERLPSGVVFAGGNAVLGQVVLLSNNQYGPLLVESPAAPNPNGPQTVQTTKVTASSPSSVTAGFGARRHTYLSTSGGDRPAATEDLTWQTATDATRTSRYQLRLVRAGSEVEALTVDAAPKLTLGSDDDFGRCVTLDPDKVDLTNSSGRLRLSSTGGGVSGAGATIASRYAGLTVSAIGADAGSGGGDGGALILRYRSVPNTPHGDYLGVEAATGTGAVQVLRLLLSGDSADTPLLLRHDGALRRVKAGPPGSGPGGTGRTLYLED